MIEPTGLRREAASVLFNLPDYHVVGMVASWCRSDTGDAAQEA